MGWSNSPAQVIPRRFMTAIERWLAGRERHDLLESRVDESEVDRLACGLGGVAVAPVRASEAPADLDARRELSVERMRQKTDIPDERRHIGHLDGPQPEAACVELREDAFPHDASDSARVSVDG